MAKIDPKNVKFSFLSSKYIFFVENWNFLVLYLERSERLKKSWSTNYLERSERLKGYLSTNHLERSEGLKGSWSTNYLERSERFKRSWSTNYLERNEKLKGSWSTKYIFIVFSHIMVDIMVIFDFVFKTLYPSLKLQTTVQAYGIASLEVIG